MFYFKIHTLGAAVSFHFGDKQHLNAKSDCIINKKIHKTKKLIYLQKSVKNRHLFT